MTHGTDTSPLSVFLSRVDASAGGSPAGASIASGFPSLDSLLGGGFRRGDLIVLGGDASSGKSALALAFALRAAVAERRVAFLSGEMTVERVLERVMAIEARVRIDDLRQGKLDDEARVRAGAAAFELRNRLPVIDRLSIGRGSAGVASVLDECPDIELMVIDSVVSLVAGARATNEETATVIRELKALALDRHTAILTTAPLPELVPRNDRRPVLDDFGALGSVKEQADVVLGLFREDMYEPARDIVGATELLVRKNRNGPVGYVDLYFYAQWMRFEDMLDPDR